jgi:SAM-dependent methyltransferase
VVGFVEPEDCLENFSLNRMQIDFKNGTSFFIRAKNSLWRRTILKLKLGLGLPIRLNFDDRNVLENIIFPEISERAGTVLFVGCEYYTKHYENYFRNSTYWTIEIAPEKSKWGAKQKHIIDGLQNIEDHFSQGSLDVIICNGVYGWGLNQKDDIEKSVSGCFKVLKPGGLFVVGWNNVPEHTPVAFSEIESFKGFKKFYFEKLNTSSYQCQGAHNHIFDFYQKPSEI